jgi:hypothetical protein
MTELLKRLKELENSHARGTSQHVKFEDDRTLFYVHQNNRLYIPTATGHRFHDDDSFVRLVVGPYGSGKSTMCVQHIVRTACQMPIWFNGRRKARWAIVRNTSGELYSTTLQTWLAWFGELGDIHKRQKPLLTYEHMFNDGYGVVELEVIFLALDRPDDVRKVKSLELTGVYLNELSELPQNALSHFKGRVNGRYPSRQFCSQPYWSGIIADTNPCETDHWIYRDFEERPVENYRLFKQPPGLVKDKDGKWQQNVYADNVGNLAGDYYTKLSEGQTENFVKVFCLGDWGSVGFGKIVYPEYNDDLHSADGLKAIQGDPIDLAFDFGLTPACLVTQLTPRGKLIALKEYCSEGMGIRTFVESVVLPGLERDFPYCPIGESNVGDPAGGARDTIIEELSCIGELNEMQIKTIAARSNDLEPRLASVRFFLNTMIDGKPAFQLDRKNCPTLRKGFIKDYFFQRLAVSGEERYKDKPFKNMASHIHDPLQYRAMEHAAASIIKKKGAKEPENMFNPAFRYL